MGDAFIPTNSLSSVNFDILKMDAIEDPLINVNKLATMDFEECYMAQAVEFINECRRDITDKKITFYKQLNESTTERMVLESFSDFFSGVKDIISKFIKFLRKLVDKFFIAMMKIVKSDNFIKKHKEDFNRITEEFDFRGFEYTFTPNIPSGDAALAFNNSLFDTLYGDEKRNLTAQSVKDSVIAMDLEKDYNEFRAKVIGKDGDTIYVSEFSQALFEVYRNGQSDPETITADSAYVRRCLDRFLNYEKSKKEIEHNRKSIEDAYNKVEKQVSEIVKRNTDLDKEAFLSRLPQDNGIMNVQTTGSGTLMAAELMTQIDVYVKAKIDQIQEYSNIHLLAFSAKLDAMKECFIQDRTVLYTSLSKNGLDHDKKGGK